MTDTSMTIRERVAEVICRSACTDLDGVGGCECAEDGTKPQCVNVLAAADAALPDFDATADAPAPTPRISLRGARSIRKLGIVTNITLAPIQQSDT